MTSLFTNSRTGKGQAFNPWWSYPAFDGVNDQSVGTGGRENRVALQERSRAMESTNRALNVTLISLVMKMLKRGNASSDSKNSQFPALRVAGR